MKISTYELAEARAVEYAKKVAGSAIVKEDFMAGYLEARTDETIELINLKQLILHLYEQATEYYEYRTAGIIEQRLADLGLKVEE